MEGKVAIVTGAASPRGEAIALALAKAGAKVCVSDLNPDKAERVADQIKALGSEAITALGDVGNKFQCVSIVEATREAFGQIDILVNNAEIETSSSVLKLDEWEWDRTMEINLKAKFFMSQLVGRVMSWENQERGGVIINIASQAGVNVPLEGRAAYCAAMAGVVGFGRECAREFAEFGVRVHTLLPEFGLNKFDDLSREIVEFSLGKSTSN